VSSREDEHVVMSEMAASWPRAVLHPQQQPMSEFEADVAIATQIAGVLLGGSEASLQPPRVTATATAPPAARGVLACCAALVVWKTISADLPDAAACLSSSQAQLSSLFSLSCFFLMQHRPTRGARSLHCMGVSILESRCRQPTLTVSVEGEGGGGADPTTQRRTRTWIAMVLGLELRPMRVPPQG